VSLYGDAIRALRQVILLDERVRNSAIDLARLSQEVADLRDRVSRLEGMLAAGLALSREAGPRRDDAGCRELPIRRAEFSLVSIRRVRNAGAAANAPAV
jgi:hypothetical protein